jgi:regulator of replication initiation timing
MKRSIIAILFLISVNSFAQIEDQISKKVDEALAPLKNSVKLLQGENNKLRTEIENLKARLGTADTTLADLKVLTGANSNAIKQTTDRLGIKITEVANTSETKINEVDKSLGTTSLYAIVGLLLALVISVIIYWLLSKKQKTDKSAIIDQLSKTKSSIEESLVTEFGKQTGLLDSQLELIRQQKVNVQATPNAEPDHSLALKVASEINLIQRNISLMDAGTKGLKQLQRSVDKLKDNLAANGYEMPVLLGQRFNTGMNLIVTNSIPDENLEKDAEIITKILIPQVNYNDKMIQAAQIEVSVGV